MNLTHRHPIPVRGPAAPGVAAFAVITARRALRRLARAAGSGLLLSTVLLGLPVVLWVVQPPVWRAVGWSALIYQPMQAPVGVLTVIGVGWLLWAWLAYATITDLITLLRHRPALRTRLPAPLHTAVTGLAGAVAFAATPTAHAGTAPTVAGPPIAATGHTAMGDRPAPPSGPAPARTPPQSPALSPFTVVHIQAPASGSDSGLDRVTDTVSGRGPSHATGPKTVTVQPGDTLWGIADQCLGDPHRWRQIYHLNTDRYRMRGGDHIEPTWTLAVPADATIPTTDQPPGPPPAGHHPPTPTPPAPTPSALTPSPSATPTEATPTTGESTDATDLHDDGVVPQPSTTPTGTPSASASPGGVATTGHSPQESGGRGPRGFTLPTGSWVDLGLALAVLAAAALVVAHRRRRYQPRPPSPQPRLDDPDVTMPPVIARLRRAVRQASPLDATDPPAGPADDGTAAPTGHRPTTPIPTRRPDTATLHDNTRDADDRHPDHPQSDHPQSVDSQSDDARADDGPDRDGATVAPVLPALAGPYPAVWPRTGLGLTGPRAADAARGFLTAALAAGGLDDPDARSHVVMPAATAHALLGPAGDALPNTPRLTVTTDLATAYTRLEEIVLYRARLLDQHDADTVTALRAVDPFTEPLPPVLLLAEPAPADHTRIAALLAQGHRLDIHGVLLGAWPHGPTIIVNADGSSTPADTDHDRHHPAAIARLTVLTATETTDLLAVLAESHTGQPAPEPTDRSRSATSGQPSHEPRPTDHADTDASTTAPAQDPSTAGTPPTEPTEPEPSPRVALDGPQQPATDAHTRPHHVVGAPETTDPADGDGGAVDAGDPGTHQPVRVLVLGAPEIVDMDTSKAAPRGKSLEVLVYLAVHDAQVHHESIIDDVLADAPAKRASHRLHTYVSDLRQVLRRTGGPADYLTRTGSRYTLNRDTLDVDLWQMQRALHDAEQATEPAAKLTALRAAVTCYRGDLAAGADYEWIEPYREAARQQAIDATLALADALTDRPAEALPVIEAALTHSPHTEALYQAAMRANAALGDLDAIRDLRRTMTSRLADIDTDPTNETLTLADQLAAGLQTPTRRTTPRAAASNGQNSASS